MGFLDTRSVSELRRVVDTLVVLVYTFVMEVGVAIPSCGYHISEYHLSTQIVCVRRDFRLPLSLPNIAMESLKSSAGILPFVCKIVTISHFGSENE